MKPFIRKKRINGRDYLYEITPYYDRTTKRIRQRSRYLGKDVDGEPVRVRESPTFTVASFGAVAALYAVALEEGLVGRLERDFGQTEGRTLLVLAFNMLTRRVPENQVSRWYRRTDLPSIVGPLPLSAGRIADLLAMEDGVRKPGLVPSFKAVAASLPALAVLDDGSPSSADALLVKADLANSEAIGCARVPRSTVTAEFLADAALPLGPKAIIVLDEGFSTRMLVEDMASSGAFFASIVGQATPGSDWVLSIASVAASGSVRFLGVGDPSSPRGTYMSFVDDKSRRRKVDAFLASAHDALRRLDGRPASRISPDIYAREALHPMGEFIDWRVIDGRYRAFPVRFALRKAEWLVGRRVLLTNMESGSAFAERVIRTRDTASTLVQSLFQAPAGEGPGGHIVASIAMCLMSGVSSRLKDADLADVGPREALAGLDGVVRVASRSKAATLSGVDKETTALLRAFGLCA